MNQLFVVILLVNFGFIMYKFGPLGFFLTLGLATAAYYFLDRLPYLKKTWPIKAAAMVVMILGVVAVHLTFKMMPLTFAIALIETIAFFIFGNIQKF